MERYGRNRRTSDQELGDHRVDEYAHNESWSRQRKIYIDAADQNLATMIGDDRTRLTRLERFAEQVKGGGIVLGAMIGGGVLVVLAHLVHLI